MYILPNVIKNVIIFIYRFLKNANSQAAFPLDRRACYLA